jgi:ElaB/YqjD/DUF883 family membrane-anchored ribosome-binding protein
MSTTTRDTAQRLRKGAAAVADDLTDGMEQVRDQGSEEIRNLFADVEDLVRKLAHVTDADIARMRQKVEDALVGARQSVAQGAANVRAGSRQFAKATDGYVRDRPWTALGIAAGAGLLLGLLSSRRQ